MRRLCLSLVLVLAACSAPQEPERDNNATGATVAPTAKVSGNAAPGMKERVDTPTATASGDAPKVIPLPKLPKPPPPPAEYPPPAPPPPVGANGAPEMIAGCTGMSPERRPRGSNCHGIMPEQCGADRAQRYVGKRLTSELRAYLHGISTQMTRIYRRGDAVTDDLNDGRLNVVLDGEDRIVSVDCH